MADRGLRGSPVAQVAQAFGWHYLLHVQRQTRICRPDGTVQRVADLVPTPGTHGLLSDVLI